MTSTSSHPDADRDLAGLLRVVTLVALAVLLLVVAFLIGEAQPALVQVGLIDFVAGERWAPLRGQFNLTPMIAGSILVTIGALALAAPAGIAAALLARFFAPLWLGWVLRRVLELLAGIPSVVYGFWGLSVIVPWIGTVRPPGANLASAILVLSLMIVPTVALTADSSLGSVPKAYLRGAAALGFSRPALALRVALPAARGGIAAGLILATGRALGETVAVMMVAGNIVQLPATLLDPVRTLTANIALEMAYAASLHRSTLFLSGLLLVLLAMILVAATHQLQRRGAR